MGATWAVFQGKVYRIAMVNKYPILTLNYTAGLKGVMGSSYNYQKVSFTFDKRFICLNLDLQMLILKQEQCLVKFRIRY